MTDRPSHDAMYNVLHPGRTLVGPGDQGAAVRDLQARLRQIAWYFGDVTGTYDDATVTAVKGFQAKRVIPVTGDVDQRTLDRLSAMTADARPTTSCTTSSRRPARSTPRCLTGRVLCIDKTSRTLRWVVDGHVLQQLDARFGSTLNDTPTREGLFHVYLKDADHVSHLYGSSMPYAMFFSGGQAVHYSSDFADGRLLRRVPRLREHPRLRRHQVAVLPGTRRGQGRRLLVLTRRARAPVTSATPAVADSGPRGDGRVRFPTVTSSLTVRTTELPVGGPLLDLLPADADPVTWLRRDEGLVGWGVAAQIRTRGPDPLLRRRQVVDRDLSPAPRSTTTSTSPAPAWSASAPSASPTSPVTRC